MTTPTPAGQTARLRRWLGVLGAYFGAQGLAQLLSLTAGFLFIRSMAVEEYALYTLAFSVISFFTFATDLGSTASLVYFFHRAGDEPAGFAPYRAAVFSLRRAAFALGALAVLAAFPWVAAGRGFALGAAALAAVAIVLSVAGQLSAAIDLLLLRLADRYARSYRAEVVGAAVRCGLALGLAATARWAGWLPAWAAVGSGALAVGTTAWLARTGEPHAPAAGLELGPYRRQILRYLLPTLPGAVYFSFQAPLVVWLAATFGATRNIAEVGALGRLGMVFGVFTNLIQVVFLPRLAQLRDERLYLRRCLAFAGFLAAIAAGLFAFATLFPQPFLWVLGPRYQGLHAELLLVVAGAGVTLLSGYAVAVNGARSWNRWQAGAMVVLIAAQGTLAATLPLSTTAGLLWFNLGTALVGLLLQVAIAAVGFSRPRWVHW